PQITDYTADLRDRTVLRGCHLLNMMRGLPFDARRGPEWLSDDPPQPWAKIWQETKRLIRRREGPYDNNKNSTLLNVYTDIDASKLLLAVRNSGQLLLAPLLGVLLHWEATNSPSSKPSDEQVKTAIIAEKARLRDTGKRWNRPNARVWARS